MRAVREGREGSDKMKLIVAVLLNVVLSVGAMCFLFVTGVTFWVGFLLFLVAFIPGANYVVSSLTGINVMKRIFQ